MLLSVIICVYDTPISFLNECILSIVNSTILLCDYEIILVDDGSNRDYSELVSKYSLRYIRTDKKGILSARLTGIAAAEGKYVAFCDSDDTVSINYYLPMLDRAVASGADIVFNDWAFRTERVRYVCKRDSTVSSDFVLVGDEPLKRFFSVSGREHSYFVLWNKIYKREILLSARARCLDFYSDGYNYSEDALINFFAFLSSSNVQNIHTGYYFYRIHTGQSINVPTVERLDSQIDFMARTLSVMRLCVATLDDRDYYTQHLNSWTGLMARTHYTYAKNMGFVELYAKIQKLYNQAELKPSTRVDGGAYSSVRLLPENFEKIDKELLAVIKCSGERVVDSSTLDSYGKKTLELAAIRGENIVLCRGKGIKITRPKIRLALRILHNRFFYLLATFLFPKGSKIRAALKRLI